MSVLASAALSLLTGAPVSAVGRPPAEPGLTAAPTERDLAVDQPMASPVVAERPLPDAAAGPPSPTAPVAAAPGRSTDENEIVVTSRTSATPGDPMEKANAQSFAATQAVDKAFVGPVAIAYKRVLPAPVRSGLRNILNNLHEPVVFLNFLLQLKPGKAVETLGRFTINSTIGGAGLVYVAKRPPFRLPRRANGFADSLGYYGVKPGPFLFLPLIGPTTLRDFVGGEIDALVLPMSLGKLYGGSTYPIPRRAVRVLDNRAEFDEQLHKLRDDTADPYVARREYYLQQRQAEIDELRGGHRGVKSRDSAPAKPAVDVVTPPKPPMAQPVGVTSVETIAPTARPSAP